MSWEKILFQFSTYSQVESPPYLLYDKCLGTLYNQRHSSLSFKWNDCFLYRNSPAFDLDRGEPCADTQCTSFPLLLRPVRPDFPESCLVCRESATSNHRQPLVSNLKQHPPGCLITKLYRYSCDTDAMP